MERNGFARVTKDEASGDSMRPGGFCGHTYERYLNHWIGFVIRPLLPSDARIETGSCFNDPCLWMDWEVRGGKGGLSRRSRRINLLVEAQALDEYITHSAPEARMLADMRLKQFIEKKLKTFNPDPDPPDRQLSGGDLWVVTSRILQRTG